MSCKSPYGPEGAGPDPFTGSLSGQSRGLYGLRGAAYVEPIHAYDANVRPFQGGGNFISCAVGARTVIAEYTLPRGMWGYLEELGVDAVDTIVPSVVAVTDASTNVLAGLAASLDQLGLVKVVLQSISGSSPVGVKFANPAVYATSSVVLSADSALELCAPFDAPISVITDTGLTASLGVTLFYSGLQDCRVQAKVNQRLFWETVIPSAAFSAGVTPIGILPAERERFLIPLFEQNVIEISVLVGAAGQDATRYVRSIVKGSLRPIRDEKVI